MKTTELERRNKLCEECEADCIYNPEGFCLFPLIANRKAVVTEDEGCLDGIPGNVNAGWVPFIGSGVEEKGDKPTNFDALIQKPLDEFAAEIWESLSGFLSFEDLTAYLSQPADEGGVA